MAILEITLLFLGSVIGAGFATGAEIITFFGALALPVWVIATMVGLTMFAIIALEIYLHYPHSQQQPIVLTPRHNFGSKLLDIVFILIYLTLFTAMTAGITQITNVGICIISLVISACIVLFGFNSLARLNFYIVLIIIILIITTALPNLCHTTFTMHYDWRHLPSSMVWAVLYAGLNCLMFPELITAAAQRHSKRTLFGAAAITALLVTILVGLILTTIRNTHTQSANVPLLAAAPNAITLIIILLAILTSQYAALFAILQRTQKILPATKKRPLLSTIGLCVCAFIGSFCGFNRIIDFAYPLIGAFTCVFLLISWLVARHLRRQVHH